MNRAINQFLEFFKYLIDATRLTLKRIKLLFFFTYITWFSFNYFIDFRSENGKILFAFEPSDVPVSIVIITAVLIIFLTLLDVIDISNRSNRLFKLIESDRIPLSLRTKALEELAKLK